MLNYRDVAKIFEEIEIMLISSLKRNLGHHKNEEKKYGFKWSAWQAEKLRSIDKFRQENARIMNHYTNVIDTSTRQIMYNEFAQGLNGINTAVPENIPDTPAELTREPAFFGDDRIKIDKLVKDVVTLEKHVETAVLRTMDDVYRQTVNKAQLAMSTGTPLQKAIDMAMQDFLSKGINCIVYRNGRRVNVADYVRMALRTTSTRAALYAESAKVRRHGYDTVSVTSYGMCSETCLPWQGRVYIDDVFSLWDGEIEERSDGGLWGKSHYCGKWFPLLSNALHGGLFHPNCRHSIIMWRDGDSIPEPMDNSGIQRRYKLEQHQRQLENKVRKAKRFAVGQSDPANVKKANKLLREAQKELREFIANTNRSEGAEVLKRDYGREKIYNNIVPVSIVKATPTSILTETESNSIKLMMNKSEGVLLTSSKPIIHNNEEYSDMLNYANTHKINIDNIKSFDGDMELLKSQIDAISEIREEYNITSKMTINFGRMDDAENDLAVTKPPGNAITFNIFALRDKDITTAFLREDNHLATNEVKGIGYHEMGHVISMKYGEIGLDTAVKAYYNIYKEEITSQYMLNWLRKNISIYSVYIPPNKVGKYFKSKNYREITPEILSLDKTNPNEFTNEFIRLLKEVYNL